MKKAVAVRSNLPDESNTVIQKTAGRTLFSSRDKSSVGRCPVSDCAARVGDGDDVRAGGELETICAKATVLRAIRRPLEQSVFGRTPPSQKSPDKASIQR